MRTRFFKRLGFQSIFGSERKVKRDAGSATTYITRGCRVWMSSACLGFSPDAMIRSIKSKRRVPKRRRQSGDPLQVYRGPERQRYDYSKERAGPDQALLILSPVLCLLTNSVIPSGCDNRQRTPAQKPP